MKIHPSITLKRITDACERRLNSLDNPGFCYECGHEQEGCEPDAQNYRCEECDQHTVFGAEELLFMVQS